MPTLSMKSHTYPSLERCIYCLKPFPTDELTDEHIVPLALNGTLVIRDAACEKCRDRSNRVYEQAALNADLLVPRLLLELKRRKKTKKVLPPVAIGDHTMSVPNECDVLGLELAQYPPFFELIVFSEAGMLVGVDRGSDLRSMRIQFANIRKRVEGRTYQSATTRHPHNHTAFSLSLAKIAYSYAVAEFGLDGFDGSEVRALLQGERDDVYNFVGSPPLKSHLTERHLHSLHVRRKGPYLTVLVHLFASFGMEPYQVVVGGVQ